MADYNINAITRRVVFTGSAGLGPYAFTFEVLDQDDIAVYFNATKLTITTDYTVTVNANGTGSVTIVTGGSVPSTPDADDSITIVGARDIERTTDFVTAGDLRAAALNEQLDGQIIMTQQLAEENKRSMQAPVTDPAHVDDGGTLDMTLPAKADRAGKVLQFNATTGNPEAGPTADDVSNAQTYANNASASATAAASSATSAASSATSASNAQTSAETAQTAAETAETNAETAQTAAEAAQTAAETAQTAAETAETNAATSATTATTKASEASTSATNAATSATSAATAQTAAETAQTAAEAAQTAAELAADNFDDTYLGAKASDPTLDNDGDALNAGDLYFNTTSSALKYFDGSAWQSITAGISDIVSDTTPQLGGNLDVQTFSIVSTANQDINITPNGTGDVSLGNFTFDADQTVGSGQDDYLMTYDHTSGKISLEAAPAGGAGYFQGENGATGDTTNGKGDIFRVHEDTLNTNVTIASGDNALCAGPLTIASGVTLTVNGNLSIV